MKERDVTAERPFVFRPHERTEGLHLSDILRLMRFEWLNERFKSDDELFDDERQSKLLTFEQGYIWEDALSIAFGWPFTPTWQDVPLDGILLNPDKRFRIDDGFVDEFKFTTKSANQPPSLILPWMWQNKAYAYALSTPDVVYCGRFYVLYSHGDYGKNRNPIYRCYEYDYNYQELYENWQAILNFAKARNLLKEV